MKLWPKKNQVAARVRNPHISSQNDELNFRRSRTLTGSSSSKVNSTITAEQHLVSPRLRLQELKKHRRGLVGGIMLSLVCIIGLFYLISQFVGLNPNSISYTSQVTATPPGEQYAQTIGKYFAAHPLERFNFLLDETSLVEFVSATHPEVESVQVNTPLGGAQAVDISLRKPLLAWQAGSTSLYVDKGGVAFKNNYYAAPNLHVNDQTGANLANEVLASERFIQFVGQVVDYLNQAKVGEVSEVIIPRGTLREVDLKLDGSKYLIKTHIDREPYTQAIDAANAVKYLKSRDITPKYIDVRIEGKAYYR